MPEPPAAAADAQLLARQLADMGFCQLVAHAALAELRKTRPELAGAGVIGELVALCLAEHGPAAPGAAWPTARRQRPVCRVSVSSIAAMVGMNPYAELSEILMELLYQVAAPPAPRRHSRCTLCACIQISYYSSFGPQDNHALLKNDASILGLQVTVPPSHLSTLVPAPTWNCWPSTLVHRRLLLGSRSSES